MQTERITILASPNAKRQMAARALSQGLSLGEYVRRKALDDDDLTPEQEAELTVLTAEVREALPKMQASFERINARLESMVQKNEEFLKKMGVVL